MGRILSEVRPVAHLVRTLGLDSDATGLILQAMSHASYVNEHPELGLRSNERLEFLGDAVIGLVVAHALFRDYPSLDEGQMTLRRIALVRQENLARVAERLELGAYLLLGRSALESDEKNRPSVLAAAFEALVGALYLACGMQSTTQMVLDWLDVAEGSSKLDAKSRLQETVQRSGQHRIRYHVDKEEGPDHSKTFYVSVWVDGRRLAFGSGHSKKSAEQDAAASALRLVRLNSDDVPN